MAGYIGSRASVVSSGAERKKTFAITTTTTVLTGLSYTPTFVHLFHNGVRLVDGTDYTATNGTSITLTTAAENGDEVVVISYASFQVADAYTKAEADSAFVSDPNGAVTVDGSGNVGIGAAVPSSDVDILGSSSRIRLDGSSASFQILSRNTADSTTNALTFDADSYTFNRAGSTKAVIDSSGRLLVGLSSSGNAGTIEANGTIISRSQSINTFAYDQAGIDFNASTKEGRFFTTSSNGTGGFTSFYTGQAGGSEKMRIDAAGRVTMPYQPAWFATGNAGWHLSANSGVIPLAAVPLNRGNHYNTSGSKFTAPVSGVYHVNIMAYMDTAAQLCLKLNGTDYIPTGGDTGFILFTNNNTGSEMASVSGVIHLSAGDYIQLGARNSQVVYVYTGHSAFSGYLLG